MGNKGRFLEQQKLSFRLLICIFVVSCRVKAPLSFNLRDTSLGCDLYAEIIKSNLSGVICSLSIEVEDDLCMSQFHTNPFSRISLVTFSIYLFPGVAHST